MLNKTVIYPRTGEVWARPLDREDGHGPGQMARAIRFDSAWDHQGDEIPLAEVGAHLTMWEATGEGI